MSNHYQVEIEQQPIELYKLLKIANLVAGGGEAKVVISEGYVLLNGEIETQKRKKIFTGDIIEFNGDIVELICHNEPEETPPRINKESPKAKKSNSANAKKQGNKTKLSQNKKTSKPKKENASGRRRSIKF